MATDDQAVGVKIAGVFIIFLCTIIGTIPPYIFRTAQLAMTEQRQRLFSWMNCLGGGIFLGFGFLHILPEAIREFDVDTKGFPLIYFLALCGFMLILLVEKFFTYLTEQAVGEHKDNQLDREKQSSPHDNHALFEIGGDDYDKSADELGLDDDHDDGDDKQRADRKPENTLSSHPSSGHSHTHGLPIHIESPLLPYILTVGLSFHSFFEGMALGLTHRFVTAVVILLGLALHKSAETFAIGVKLVNTTITNRKWILLMLTYSSITPLGILSGLLIENSVSENSLNAVSSIFQSITVGTFLYVGILGTVVEEFASHSGLVPKASLFFSGLLLMAFLSMLDP